jgi:hypothetical protein
VVPRQQQGAPFGGVIRAGQRLELGLPGCVVEVGPHQAGVLSLPLVVPGDELAEQPADLVEVLG